MTGCCASQSICRSGCSSRSSAAIATSRRAWPRPIGEDRYSARSAAGAARAAQVRRCGVAARPGRRTRVISWLISTGSPGRRPVAGALEQHQRRRRSARPAARRSRAAGSGRRCRGRRGPGTRTCAHSGSTGVADRAVAARAGRRWCRPASAGSIVVRPADAVLDLLGRVRLGEHLLEEEPDEVVVVAVEPVVLVVLRPSPRWCRVGSSQAYWSRLGLRHRRTRRTGAIATMPGHPLGVPGGDVHRPGRPAGQRRPARPARSRWRPARRRCRRRTPRRCTPPRRRAAGATAAPAVEGDHPVVPRQVRRPAPSRTASGRSTRSAAARPSARSGS